MSWEWITLIENVSNNCVKQLLPGHGRGEQLIGQPRAVSALIQKDCLIRHMACSEAATVIATSRGDVFALYKYQCRKIASKYESVVLAYLVIVNCFF